MWRKKTKISKNHLFSRIGPFWVIWSKKNFFDFWIIQKFQKPSLTAKIVSFDPEFSWTWNFQGLFLTILSTIPEDFGKIVWLDFLKSSKNHQKRQFFVKFWIIQSFFGKSGSVSFLSLSPSNFWPKIRMILCQEVS